MHQRQLSAWRAEHRQQVQAFRREQKRRYAAVRQQRQLLRMARAQPARNVAVPQARERIREYWRDRADEVRAEIPENRDRLFNDRWWEQCAWTHHSVDVGSPWWWWQPAPWNTVNVFLQAGWSEPALYDYGTDIITDGDSVYEDGQRIASTTDYARGAVQLANPGVAASTLAPVEADEWTPLGVWALVQEEQGSAVMFFQLSVNRQGVISGGYENVVSGEELPVIGSVDRATQRAAWHIGDRTDKVFEAGIANLGQDEASCLVHIGDHEMQPWLLVRLKAPELPNAPAAFTQASATP